MRDVLEAVMLIRRWLRRHNLMAHNLKVWIDLPRREAFGAERTLEMEMVREGTFGPVYGGRTVLDGVEVKFGVFQLIDHQERALHEMHERYSRLSYRYWDEVLRLREQTARMSRALEKIEAWQDFPATGRTWESGQPMSYATAYGSNGERDYMRGVARDALEAVSAMEKKTYGHTIIGGRADDGEARIGGEGAGPDGARSG